MKNIKVQPYPSRPLAAGTPNLLTKWVQEEPLFVRQNTATDINFAMQGMTLAKGYSLVKGRTTNTLLKRLIENEKKLAEAHQLLKDAKKEKFSSLSGAEWFLDNFYVINSHVRKVKPQLPKFYDKDLERMSAGSYEGLPRVYAIAVAALSTADGRIALNTIKDFITGYQDVSPLTLRELWCTQAMFQLAILEHLRRLSSRIVITEIYKDSSQQWAQSLMDNVAEADKIEELLQALARTGLLKKSAFLTAFTRKLRQKGNVLDIVIKRVNQQVEHMGLQREQIINSEIERQAEDQSAFTNCIHSLHVLDSIDWKEFVEECSVVEHVLRNDAGHLYAEMDFYTRDQYRKAVEKIAMYSPLSETEIAEATVQLSQQAQLHHGQKDVKVHVGFYLIGDGRRILEQYVRMHVPVGEKIQQLARKHHMLFYFGSMMVITLAISAILLFSIVEAGAAISITLLAAVFILFCASDLSVTFINWFVTFFIKPVLLPKMDFSDGIPTEATSLVVVPCMLGDKEDIEELIQALEVRFLANRTDNLFFGLLTDFQDAMTETLPHDRERLEFAVQRVEALNRKYCSPDKKVFYLFHRPRRWNRHDRVWIGYERKRGKLLELSALLRGTGRDRFSYIVGDTEALKAVKYVITLDADTQLPRDSAWKMIATMAHPLNRPVYCKQRERVVSGYGMLQPRVGVSPEEINTSFYTYIHGHYSGLDQYTRAVSDVYQDLFGEGSFTGKGIYDVDLYNQILSRKLPENRILSHDLIEGCYLRCGLLSSVQLYEKNPSSHSIDVKRRHRWIRGDWQIASWVLPWTRIENNEWERNRLSLLSRWKILDNLRRSSMPLMLLGLLLAGFIALPNIFLWTFFFVSVLTLRHFITIGEHILRSPERMLQFRHWRNAVSGVSKNFMQSVLTIIFLPHEVQYTTNAILKTNYRLFITRRNMLEWNPFNNVSSTAGNVVRETLLTMYSGPLLSVLIFGYMYMYLPERMIVAIPFLALWTISPVVMLISNVSLIVQKPKLKETQLLHLRKYARKTWFFFENFAGGAENWLPPDNYQEYPVRRIAHHTSPTNIGLSLLAGLAACDFGYQSLGQFIRRTSNTLDTLKKLDRYQGHFFNWYNTQSLIPVNPRYISTVDSGNLIGHLLTLRQGLLAMPNQPILGDNFFQGVSDTLAVFESEVNDKKIVLPAQEIVRNAMKRPLTPEYNKVFIDSLVRAVEDLVPLVSKDDEPVAYAWVQTLSGQVNAMQEELALLMPWLTLAPDQLQMWKDVVPAGVSTYAGLHHTGDLLLERILHNHKRAVTQEERTALGTLHQQVSEAIRAVRERMMLLEDMALQCIDFSNVSYSFLYNKSRRLLSIGYAMEAQRQDAACYDMLASEARLAVFTGIAQGKLPEETWFSLGKPLVKTGADFTLLSWSGSMFEYLMPALVMPSRDNTLLGHAGKAAVQRQIEYGKRQGIPWGVSECAFNEFDPNLNYQYNAFGVPELRVKDVHGENMIVAPYASMLALMVCPEEACENLQRISADGGEGRFGFYEAMDYNAMSSEKTASACPVQLFMAHHQGMSFLSLAQILLDSPMQKRFEREPQFRTALLLLQEAISKEDAIVIHKPDGHFLPEDHDRPTTESAYHADDVITTAFTPVPQVQLLSNGRYKVMLTNAGGGYTRWRNIALTRWHEDTTRDNWGMFCYIKDIQENNTWSTTHHPVGTEAMSYEVTFPAGSAMFRREDTNFGTFTRIALSPEDDLEIRRVTLTNKSEQRKLMEVTSYAELVMLPAEEDELNPIFGKLFIETKIHHDKHAIVCRRRPRAGNEHGVHLFHCAKVHNAIVKSVDYETDRVKFVGRGNTLATADAINGRESLSGSEGSVLDPVVAIRYRVVVEAGATATLDFYMGVAENHERCGELVEKCQGSTFGDQVFQLAETYSRALLRRNAMNDADASLFRRLAAPVIYSNAAWRPNEKNILENAMGQSLLWNYGISGNLPVVLFHMADPLAIDMLQQLIQAHTYWKQTGLSADLVICVDEHGRYNKFLYNQVLKIIEAGIGSHALGRNGGVFVLDKQHLPGRDFTLLEAMARIVVTDDAGSLEEFVRQHEVGNEISRDGYSEIKKSSEERVSVNQYEALLFDNEVGGFSEDGREYIIRSGDGKRPPLPWINVLANPEFGSLVTDSGPSYTWVDNAHEFRLTSWNNDVVSDAAPEVFYLRDEETGQFWFPTPALSDPQATYRKRHGFGYSIFEYVEQGIKSTMSIHVDLTEKIKFTVLKVRNLSTRKRSLSVTGYAEMILGEMRSKSSMHIQTEMDEMTGVLLARNPYNTDFRNQVCFFHVEGTGNSFTGDRREFIGRNGGLSNPAAMRCNPLSGQVGAALDPCMALRTIVELDEGQETEITFTFGIGQDTTEATQLAKRYTTTQQAHSSLEKVNAYWHRVLGVITVVTPDESLNVLANGWLLYQTISSRIWGRTGYYQSGGAFGFRDQLQDIMAVIHSQPEIAREHILRCAAYQFVEGDVLHWWHPPTEKGVRTHCSDDYLWLPYVTGYYISRTGDWDILDIPVNFLKGGILSLDEESHFALFDSSGRASSLYEHCVRAIKHGLRFGKHGLPLMGAGDWNDGMNKVGHQGKGESVWVGFFLCNILNDFSKIASRYGDIDFATHCRTEGEQLRINLEANAWDGDWYLRAYTDDGDTIGSQYNEECQIDSIAQTWSVLSGAGDDTRVRTAMAAAYRRLVNEPAGIIQILDPPFDKSIINPGYIKGYVPGVRENGGQYTHAAVWMAMAFAAIGDGKRAWDLMTMLNPINHSNTQEDMARYKVEPYVVAADIYACGDLTGRGGWTWYTGSAGWMYQLIIESLVGIKKEADVLRFEPCFPEAWNVFSVDYRFGGTCYHITLQQVSVLEQESCITVDGVLLPDDMLQMVDDGSDHWVTVDFPGKRSSQRAVNVQVCRHQLSVPDTLE